MSVIADQVFHFGAWDYTVFGVMLSISASIGVYFGFFAHSANTTDEYLMGGKKMKTIPIAISLVASQLSGTSFLVLPSEIYSFGINHAWLTASVILVVPMLGYLVIPVFYENNITNCYDYLEQRFDAKIKKLITIVFLMKVFLVLPIYMFVPSLAFSQVTGFNIHLINCVVCSVCIFYTMLGGIKAVVWTDVVQGLIMFTSVAVVALIGVSQVGGFSAVFNRALEGGRLDTNFNFDLTTRSTFWNNFIPGLLVWTSHVGFTQSCVQRLVSLPSMRQARIAICYFLAGILTIQGFCMYTGVVMYAKYADCDPVKSGVVEKSDKMIPHFVQELVGNITGMPGVFISCIFSAALSTVSANLNSLAGIVYFDYIRPKINHTEAKANLIMKVVVVLLGIYCISAGFIVEKFQSVLQLSMSISGVAFGCLFGVFMLGILVPRAHSKAILVSSISSIILSVSIVLVGKIQMAMEGYKYQTLPTSVEGCPNYNLTSIFQSQPVEVKLAEPFDIFKLSFQWYVVFGSVLVWTFGLPLSYLLKPEEDKKIPPRLFAPVIRRFLPQEMDMTYLEVPLEEKKNIIVA